jgi:hypothetical protein
MAKNLLTGAKIHRMGVGGPEGPDSDDGLGDFGGLHWEQTRQADDSGWPGGRRAAQTLAVADAVAIGVALALITATLVLGRPLGGVSLLLGPAVLLLIVGQVCAIVAILARRPPRTGRRFLRDPNRGGSISADLSSYFGPLDRRLTRAVAALCVIGFLSFLTGIFFTFHGSPAGSGGGCAYRLSAHGIDTCVSKTAYELAGAALQRMVAGIFLFFYAMHFYAALASGTSAPPEAPFAARP